MIFRLEPSTLKRWISESEPRPWNQYLTSFPCDSSTLSHRFLSYLWLVKNCSSCLYFLPFYTLTHCMHRIVNRVCSKGLVKGNWNRFLQPNLVPGRGGGKMYQAIIFWGLFSSLRQVNDFLYITDHPNAFALAFHKNKFFHSSNFLRCVSKHFTGLLKNSFPIGI